MAKISNSNPNQNTEYNKKYKFTYVNKKNQQREVCFSENDRLGKGGFGTVYLGEVPTNKHYTKFKYTKVSFKKKAVKLFAIDSDPVKAKQQERNILKECKYGQKARHLKTKKCDTQGNKIAIVMNLLPGEELFHVINNLITGDIQVDTNRLLDITSQLLKQYKEQIYDRKLIHRDIKPENIMIDDDNNLNFADFGLAISQGKVDDYIPGTLDFMAPESLEAMDKPDQFRFTSSCDIYGLGKILAELWLRYYDPESTFYTDHKVVHRHSTRTQIIHNKNFPAHISESNFADAHQDLAFVKNLIDSMTNINPELRPSIDDLISTFEKDKEDYLNIPFISSPDIDEPIAESSTDQQAHQTSRIFCQSSFFSRKNPFFLNENQENFSSTLSCKYTDC